MTGRLPSRASGPSLERKLPLWISALLVLVLAGAAWISYLEVKQTSSTAAQERLRRVTRQLADLSEASSAQRLALMTQVAADPRVTSVLANSSDSPGVLDSTVTMRLLGPTDSSRVFQLRDRRGRVLAASVMLDGDDETTAMRAIEATTESGAAEQGALYVVGDSIFYWTAAPVRRAGRVAGVLLHRRHLTNTPRVDEQIRNLVGRDIAVFVTNARGDVWATLGGRVVTSPPVSPIDSLFEYVSAGRPVIASGTPVRGTPWAIVTQIPRATVLERPRVFLRRMGIALLLLVGIGAIGAWLVSRHVTRPLAALRDAAERVASADEPPVVAVARRDELGELSVAFNVMAQRVRESRAELERQVAEARELADELRRAQRQTLRAANRTTRLQAVTAALSGAVTPEQVATVVVEQGIEAVEAQAGSILVLSPDGSTLEILRAVGYSETVLASWMTFPITANVPLAAVVRTGEPELIDNLAVFKARYGDAITAEASSRSWAALPLVVQGRPIGAMGLSFAKEGPFSQDERAFMRTLAEQCAQALDRSRLFQAELAARREAEEARRAAESANQAKSDFLAVMSHELRTPLNAIAGYTELLEMGLRGPITPEQREDLRRVRKSQHHLLTLINDVLHFAKLDAGHVEFALGDTPIDPLLEEIQPLIEPQMRAKRLRYRRERCADLVAHADPEKLRQILINLLSNAVKFTPEGGTIEVACEWDERRARIHVTDTGVGIPPERLESVFDAFFQVDKRLTRAHEGVGLGLAISRDLARGMGGELRVRSAPGAGSTFTVELARVRPASVEAPRARDVGRPTPA